MGSDTEVLIVIGPLPSMQCSEFLAQVQAMQITHTWEPAGNLVEPCWPCYLFCWSSGLHATLCTAGYSGRWEASLLGMALYSWCELHLSSFHLTKQNSFKELSQKSMPSAGRMHSCPPPHPPLVSPAQPRVVHFHLHIPSSVQTSLMSGPQPYLVVRHCEE